MQNWSRRPAPDVFDKDPSFYRATIPYDTAYGSPLGRPFKFGVTKRF